MSSEVFASTFIASPRQPIKAVRNTINMGNNRFILLQE